MTTRSDSDVRQDAGELSTREASPQKELPVKPDKPAPVPPSQHHPFAVQVSTWLLHYPRLRMVVYATASLIIGLTQGLGINLVSSNLPGIQGSLGISNVESYWLVAAYTATSVTGTILLYKIRTQFGFRRFGEYGLLFFAVASLGQTFTHDFQTALAVRAVMGFAMASLGPLALFYMFEIFPPAKKLTAGLCFGLAGSQLALPVSRIISPHLLDLGHWHQLATLESGLSLICLTIIWILPLTHPPRVKVFERTDWISYPLIATAVACMSVVLTMGRYYWWQEKDWIGEVLVVGIIALTLSFMVELKRKNPIIDLRWLMTPEMVLFTGSMLFVRMLLSEQTTGMVGFLNLVGLLNDQLMALFCVILAATFAGLVVVSIIHKANRIVYIHLFSIALIAIASLTDAGSTVDTRPEQFYLTQGMIAFAGAVFLPTALWLGFIRALQFGQSQIISFILVFLSTQNVGAQVGSAFLGTIQILREKFHSSVLVENISLQNPLVSERVAQYSHLLKPVLNDGTQLNAEGLALLSQKVTQQAGLLAYNDVFRVVFYMSLGCFAVLVVHIIVGRILMKKQTVG
ncbi:MFS transporter [Rahnella sp. C60]|uniref:MFS transporter n=1 Tax=Rahnella perminowiae TaxID=2816244 RepID=A0ABS6L2N5_9GAMM|nr:MFS transporter [Rahnella perminowiae]MBU9817584.1 MFS transporter [Rahnella perminowiae]MBU9828336.1 MFS transporter [Rahnella perminowiae]MBU9836123.1 MFS transporter [Rahnella perminowiae]MCR9001393.1 MFS transporter [Rahnella perminowiae]